MRDYVPPLRFHALTRVYDTVVRATMRDQALKRRLIAGARLHEADAVLDLGCGTATLTAMIKKSAPRAHVVGVDIDPTALALARENLRGLDVELVNGSVRQLPMADGSFDRVLSSLVLHHLDTDAKRDALAEAHRVLRPRGELHILDWGQPRDLAMRAAFLSVRLLDGFEPTRDNAHGRLPELIRQAGFVEVRIVDEQRTVFGLTEFYSARRA